MSSSTNCDNHNYCDCCKPYDLRDVLHSFRASSPNDVNNGLECYGYQCKCNVFCGKEGCTGINAPNCSVEGCVKMCFYDEKYGAFSKACSRTHAKQLGIYSVPIA
jgi:hypothetical protein